MDPRTLADPQLDMFLLFRPQIGPQIGFCYLLMSRGPTIGDNEQMWHSAASRRLQSQKKSKRALYSGVLGFIVFLNKNDVKEGF